MRLAQDKRFAFVDGFSELFAHETAVPTSPSTNASPDTQTAASSRRGQPRPSPQQQNGPAPGGLATGGPHSRRPSNWKTLRWSKQNGLDMVEKEIIPVINHLSGATKDAQAGNDTLLVIDQPDFLLAATGPIMGVGGTELSEMIMGLRQVLSRPWRISCLP